MKYHKNEVIAETFGLVNKDGEILVHSLSKPLLNEDLSKISLSKGIYYFVTYYHTVSGNEVQITDFQNPLIIE